jgi:hypothetical protein
MHALAIEFYNKHKRHIVINMHTQKKVQSISLTNELPIGGHFECKSIYGILCPKIVHKFSCVQCLLFPIQNMYHFGREEVYHHYLTMYFILY